MLEAGCTIYIFQWCVSHLLHLSYQVKEDEVEWRLVEVEEKGRRMKERMMDEVMSWWTGWVVESMRRRRTPMDL